jgi:hypothetical protein
MICSMKKAPRSTDRVSVPIPDRVRNAATYPDLVGLPEGASSASVYERLLEYGYDAAIRAKRHREQLATALAYSRDPEQRRIGPDLQRAALRKGVL